MSDAERKASPARDANEGRKEDAAPSIPQQDDAITDPANNANEPAYPVTEGDWNTAFDQNSQLWYYYNLATGERSWDPPPGWPNGTTTAAEETAPPNEHQAAPADTQAVAGYYYIDAYGNTQGPFSIEMLLQWRAALPMDLPLWYQNADDDDTKGKSKGRSTEYLASIIGDDELLAKWREENAAEIALNKSDKGCSAPTAADYEADLKKDSFTKYSEAVLQALPPEDEAVHLARMARSTGQSMRQVVGDWASGGTTTGDYTVTAMHAGRMGKIQAADTIDNSLYADMGGWVDPKSMEEQLQKAASRKKRALSGAELRAYKERKRDIKEAKTRAWLQD